jgi:hypothetical protein
MKTIRKMKFSDYGLTPVVIENTTNRTDLVRQNGWIMIFYGFDILKL